MPKLAEKKYLTMNQSRKCQSPNCEEDATVFFTKIITGHDREESCYCESCAKQQGLDYPSILTQQESLLPDEQKGTSSDKASPEKECCPQCKFTLNNLQRTGRFGCPTCYETFAQEVKSRFPSMHRGIQHLGSIPAGKENVINLQGQRQQLEAHLDIAVAKENFETAKVIKSNLDKIPLP